MVEEQSKIFCAFFVLGILIAFIFDFFRVLRKTIKTSNVMTYFEDILFFIIVGILYIKSIIILAYGDIRLYIFVASILGIIFYILTIGNLCAIIFKVILDFLKKFILCFIRILKIPLKIVNKILLKLKQDKIKNNP